MTDNRLVCRAEKQCDEPATYLVPQPSTAKQMVGWLPICWTHAKDWFATRPLIGEVLELDIVNDKATWDHMGAPEETVTECSDQGAPNAEVS